MAGIVFFIEQIAIGLYILLGLAIFLTWRRWQLARRELRSTHFELERNLARYKRANAVTMLVLLVEVVLVIVGMQQVVAPTIRAEDDTVQTIEEIADDGVFNTPVPGRSDETLIDPSNVNLTPDDLQLRVLATPTLTPTPVGTIIPNPPAAVGCEDERASLQIPTNGLRVFEPLTVIGTANVDDFAFYRFEIKGPQTLGNFAILEDHTQPVPEVGELGQFVPSFYEPGLYQFRLTVFDITNTLRASCMVNIDITDPIPTATPLQS
ncbi:MAG: hypothetical protein K8L99_06390 [Anaerolineae bacterium]|nr:hypothetical protein [Anaerolineae bacterium]